MIYYFMLVLTCMLACGWLWRLGGSGHGWCRKWIAPTIVALTYYIISGSWLSIITIPIFWAMIQWISYGENTDIQNFWELVVQGGSTDHSYTVEFLTRLTCAVCWTIPSILFVYLCNGNIALFVPFFVLRSFAIGLVGALVPNATVSEWSVGILFATVVCV
jgi:hypothetical protein